MRATRAFPSCPPNQRGRAEAQQKQPKHSSSTVARVTAQARSFLSPIPSMRSEEESSIGSAGHSSSNLDDCSHLSPLLTATLTANRNASDFLGCSRWMTSASNVAGKSRCGTPWTTVLGIRNQRWLNRFSGSNPGGNAVRLGLSTDFSIVYASFQIIDNRRARRG